MGPLMHSEGHSGIARQLDLYWSVVFCCILSRSWGRTLGEPGLDESIACDQQLERVWFSRVFRVETQAIACHPNHKSQS